MLTSEAFCNKTNARETDMGVQALGTTDLIHLWELEL